MSLYQSHSFEIPEETKEVARAAFPQGNVYLAWRDDLGPLYCDNDFASLFALRGQEGMSPGLLATVTVMQYVEGLNDRQAAEAVRSRLDWKYVLGLPLRHPGFHYWVLSPFRDRLLAGGQEALLFERVLERLKAGGWVKGGGQQRTDSTHVLAAVRQLNRLECVGESLRRVLDDLARVAPDWLLTQVSQDWFDRYGARFEMYRLPEKPAEREALQLQLGRDGLALLAALYREQALPWLASIPSVEVMRRVWLQQYYIEDDEPTWRTDGNLPPHKLLIVSPDDPQARNRTKRETNWTGYAVHLTESCDQEGLNLITHVATTPATTADVDMTNTVHQALAEKGLLPGEHLVDTAYVSVENLHSSQCDYQVDLVGPVAGGRSWQANAGKGFAASCFAVDWESQTVTCPQGKTSQNWRPRREKYGHDYIEVRFAPADCLPCACRADCTKAKRGARAVSLRPQAAYEMLQLARRRQETAAFKNTYKQRAGIEGTISQGTRSFELRRCRYRGLPKTHLQHLATAAAMNLTRLVTWLMERKPKAATRLTPFAALAVAI